MVSVVETLRRSKQQWSETHLKVRRAFESRQNFIRALETDETANGRNEERTIWKNEDLDLTPPSGWSWGWYDYAAFWWSYGFSVGVWSVGSSMVAMGLNAWQGSSLSRRSRNASNTT